MCNMPAAFSHLHWAIVLAGHKHFLVLARPLRGTEEMLRRLLVFISSTADLSEWRDAAARALNDLEIEDSRFESWPSSPNEPMTECLLRVEECDAFVLLLGSRYGSLVGSGLSATHVEYRHALDHRKPVFAYLLKSTSRDREQDTLIEEVRKNGFHCHELGDPATLEAAVRSSLLQEFTRCFRHAHQAPPTAPELQVARVPCATTGVKLPEDPAEAYGLLKNLYENGREEVIHELGTQCQSSFGNSPAIMNFVFMAEVNLGMDGCDVDRHWLAQALSFWASAAAKRRYRQDTLLYCSGNALSVLKRLPAAVKKYRDCLSLNPAFAQCWKNLGTVYVEMGDARSARQCFGEALHLDPQLTQALYSMANLLLIQENDPLGALGYLDRIDGSALPPKWSAGVRGWQAIACIRAGRFAEAIDHSEAAVALDPEAEWAWMVAARHYALARQHNKEWLDRARAFWERFLRRYPDHADAWAEAGYVLWFLRDRRDKEKLSRRLSSLVSMTMA